MEMMVKGNDKKSLEFEVFDWMRIKFIELILNIGRLQKKIKIQNSTG